MQKLAENVEDDEEEEEEEEKSNNVEEKSNESETVPDSDKDGESEPSFGDWLDRVETEQRLAISSPDPDDEE